MDPKHRNIFIGYADGTIAIGLMANYEIHHTLNSGKTFDHGAVVDIHPGDAWILVVHANGFINFVNHHDINGMWEVKSGPTGMAHGYPLRSVTMLHYTALVYSEV